MSEPARLKVMQLHQVQLDDQDQKLMACLTWMGARGLNGSQAAPARMEKVLPKELLEANLMYLIVLPAKGQ